MCPWFTERLLIIPLLLHITWNSVDVAFITTSPDKTITSHHELLCDAELLQMMFSAVNCDYNEIHLNGAVLQSIHMSYAHTSLNLSHNKYYDRSAIQLLLNAVRMRDGLNHAIPKGRLQLHDPRVL